MLTADPSARATYGDDAHRCAFCSARQTSRDPLTPATARQALVSGVAEGDLLCTVCDAGFTADADARDEMVLDAEIAKAEPDLAPMPGELSYDPAEDLAAALESQGYRTTARTLRESQGAHRVGVLREIARALPGFALDAAVSQ